MKIEGCVVIVLMVWMVCYWMFICRWLNVWDILFDVLCICKDGDFCKDVVVKWEILVDFCWGFIIVRVYDDNLVVIEVW